MLPGVSSCTSSVEACSFVPESGSFRDRTARVFLHEGRVLRALNTEAADEWDALKEASFFKARTARGEIVATKEVTDLSPPDTYARLLEHEVVPFISYPYEWSFSMLKDAALLTLSLTEEALKEDFILKDATPYNIQWVMGKPVHIDIPSFHRLRPGQVWEGYLQFCELFLYPLFLGAYKGITHEGMLRGNLEGISPEDFSKLFTWFDCLKPGILKHVKLHALLQKNLGSTDKDVKATLKNAGFNKELILVNVRSLKKLVSGLTLKGSQTEWSHYTEECVSYSGEEFQEKEKALDEVLAQKQFKLAWDIGCNTGYFTRKLAEKSVSTCGFDVDPLAIERFYLKLREEKKENILPLILNVARPSPGLGWQGLERKPVEARGKPDCILALAVIHHVVITGHIPLGEFIEWVAKTGEMTILEFVTREDKMVKKLLRNKSETYQDYTLPSFEAHFSKWFDIEARISLRQGERILFVGRSRVV